MTLLARRDWVPERVESYVQTIARQVAAQSAAENDASLLAWVDENLEGFKGRVSRDKWVEQARVLAAGGQTEFSKRAEY